MKINTRWIMALITGLAALAAFGYGLRIGSAPLLAAGLVGTFITAFVADSSRRGER